MNTRKCRYCHEIKPQSEFQGYSGQICFACKRKRLLAYMAKWRAKHPNYSKEYYEANKAGEDIFPKRVPRIVDGLRRCSRCKEYKALDNFGIEKGYPDGLNPYCRLCAREVVKERRKKLKQENPDLLKAMDKRKRALRGPEKAKADVYKWREQNPDWQEYNRKTVREWKKENPDKLKAQHQRYNERLKLKRASQPPALCPKHSIPLEKRSCSKCNLEKIERKKLLNLDKKKANRAKRILRAEGRIERRKRLSFEREFSRLGYSIIDGKTVRQCSTCLEWKSPEDIQPKTQKCLPCFREIRNAQERKYRKTHPHKRREKEHKRENRKRNAVGFHTEEEWQTVLSANGHRCLRCGTDNDLTRDHVIPLSVGGSDYPDNLQPLCRKCNSAKGDTIADYREKII